MKSIKKFYQEHRIFTILMAIVLVCVIIMITILFNCFYSGKGSNKYGNRLEVIENVQISESRQNDYEKNLENNQKVEKANVRIQGRIIYIKVKFKSDTSMDEAKNIVEKSLTSFKKEEHQLYDFNITIQRDDNNDAKGFLTSGSKNKNSKGISWNNIRVVTTPKGDDKTTTKDD